MANIPRKIKDPTEAALSAIQDALNLRDSPSQTPAQPATAEPAAGDLDFGRRNGRISAMDEDLFRDERDQLSLPGVGTDAQRRAANDDRQSVGQILQALQQRPSRLPYLFALTFSGIWTAVALAAAWSLAETGPRALLAQGGLPLLGLAVAVLLPILFFAVIAYVVVRAQELRQIARAMTQVAMRLGEPETMAGEQVVSVGQTIRREVAAMGDGVERALARAAELEGLVHNEVAALERSYNDNELRIRGLIQELATQREALVNQAEQVRSALSNVHFGLTQDITSVSELVSTSVNDAAQRITQSLAEKGEHITLALGRAGDSMIDAIGDRGGDLLEQLSRTGDEVSRTLDAANTRLISALNFKTDEMTDKIVDIAGELSDTLSTRLDRISDDISRKTTALGDLLAQRTEEIGSSLTSQTATATMGLTNHARELSESLAEQSRSITQGLESQSREIADSWHSHSHSLTESLSGHSAKFLDDWTNHSQSLTAALTAQSREITNSLTSRSNEIMTNLVETGSRLAETIVTRADDVNSTLKSTGESVVLDLSLRGGEVVGKLEEIGTRISDTIVTRGTKVTETFRETADSLAATLNAKGDAVKEMLATRLQSFEEVFMLGGSELAEKISRDSSTLGNLITRNLAEFDRTVKVYGGELAERLSTRTGEITEAMRAHVENFDSRVTSKTSEAAVALDQRIVRIEQALDNRTQSLSEMLGSRVMEIAKTLADGGKEVVGALDKRINEVTGAISARGTKLAETLSAKADEIDQVLGKRANEIGDTVESRIGRFEELLVGRVEATMSQIEARGASAAGAVSTIVDRLNQTITTNNATIETSAQEAENRLAALSSGVASALKQNAGEIERAIAALATATSEKLTGMSTNVLTSLRQDSSEIENRLGGLATSTSDAIRTSAGDAERTLTALSAGVTTMLKQNASEVERTLLGVGAEVVRSFTAKADEMNGAIGNKGTEIARLLDDRSNSLLLAIDSKSRTLVNEVGRITDATLSSIESRGVTTARALMSNSEEISRLINEASSNASATLTRQLRDLQEQGRSAVEQSQRTAGAAVSEMHETHGMLRNDVNALFERLREANSLLQEVLSGATENLGAIESSLSTRAAEFVSAMHDVGERSNAAGVQVDDHIKSFQAMSGNVLNEITALAQQFDAHGRALVAAAGLVEKSNVQIKDTLDDNRRLVDNLVGDLVAKTDHLSSAITTKTEQLSEALGTKTNAVINEFGARTEALEQRLKRFGALLTESFETSEARARDIARVISEASSDGARAITSQYDLVRSTSDDERRRTTDAMRSIFDQTNSETIALFKRTADQFGEIVHDLRNMTGEMQRELEATRDLVRKGILELPQETADSAAQMRRVIVDQIEALAELNRIVARHGRGIEAPDARRGAREEPLATVGRGGSGGVRPAVSEARAPSPVRAEPRGGDSRTGWLSDLLTRASRDEDRPRDEAPRYSIDSLDSISTDIARMVDHDAMVDLWDRYYRGERNAFSRRLYTLQGQQTFDEIRRRYRADREFKQTVDRYIAEFERLLDEVAREDRGPQALRSHLTSETGLVYTLLAHAAGRLG